MSLTINLCLSCYDWGKPNPLIVFCDAYGIIGLKGVGVYKEIKQHLLSSWYVPNTELKLAYLLFHAHNDS